MRTICPFCKDPACFVDRHHQMWPRRAYKTPLEREFRGLFIERMWRCQHNRIHRTTKPPRKPSRRVMERVVAARKEAKGNARELRQLQA